MLDRMQAEKVDQNLIIRNMNGLSSGQHLNNLGICTNGSSDPNLNTQANGSQGQSLGTGTDSDMVTEKSMRNSEIVSHSDTILDLAMVDFKSQDSTIPLLVSCSRDSTVKVWRC